MFTKLGAIAAESDKSVENFPVVRGGLDRVECLVRSIVGLSVEALDVFVDQVGAQLTDRFRTGWKQRLLVVNWPFHIR